VRSSNAIRIETGDPRSDDRRRVVDVGREAVTIRRAVAGVPMAIRIACRSYRGVALRIVGLDDGRFRYEVRLAHRDPDLSVPLAQGDDLAAVEAEWRAWVAFLRLPALAGRSESADAAVNLHATELTRRVPHERRGGRALASRRPRRLKRRACVRLPDAGVVDGDPVVLIYGWKDDC
jgi:hypothetical protein